MVHGRVVKRGEREETQGAAEWHIPRPILAQKEAVRHFDQVMEHEIHIR